MKRNPKKHGGETTSVIFQYDKDDYLYAYLPNGKRVGPGEFFRVILASTNLSEDICANLADSIVEGEVEFPYCLNITKGTK